jgi:hypothetical protein
LFSWSRVKGFLPNGKRITWRGASLLEMTEKLNEFSSFIMGLSPWGCIE